MATMVNPSMAVTSHDRDRHLRREGGQDDRGGHEEDQVVARRVGRSLL